MYKKASFSEFAAVLHCAYPESGDVSCYIGAALLAKPAFLENFELH